MTRFSAVLVTFLMVLAWPLLAAAEPAASRRRRGERRPAVSAAGLISLATLIGLEIVLGIDNVIFIAILAGRLPEDRAASARGSSGIAMARGARASCCCSRIAWVMGLTRAAVHASAAGRSRASS